MQQNARPAWWLGNNKDGTTTSTVLSPAVEVDIQDALTNEDTQTPAPQIKGKERQTRSGQADIRYGRQLAANFTHTDDQIRAGACRKCQALLLFVLLASNRNK